MFQSTHPRGVRRWETRITAGHRMFQSTHPRGVRPARSRRRHCWRYRFNPRTRVGCDFDKHQRHGFRAHVSIHAPAWGATVFRIISFLLRRVSIHAPAWGATSGCWPLSPLYHLFQSTHPRGVRLWRPGRSAPCSSVSIHAPAWGATCRCSPAPCSRLVSIHAPAWGATVSMFYPVDSRD